MDESPPLPPPDDSADQYAANDSPSNAGSAVPPVDHDGCPLIVGALGGFFFFLIAGLITLEISKSATVGILYLIGAAITAFWLATKPSWRGLAIGVFLGLGACLLLLAICSGMKFG